MRPTFGIGGVLGLKGQRIRPGTRYLQAVIDRRRSQPVVALTLDVDLAPRELVRARWRDDRGQPVLLTTENTIRDGCVRAMNYRELLEEWRIPMDSTSRPIEETDSILEPGMRRVIPIRSRKSLFELVGKEGDNLLALMIDPGAEKGAELTVYQEADLWGPLAHAASELGVDALVSGGVTRRTARRILSGGRPSSTTRVLVEGIVDGSVVPSPPRVCALPECGKPVRGRQRFHADRCRKAAARWQQRRIANAFGNGLSP